MKITDAVKKATLPALILLIASLLAAGVLVAPVLAQHAGHGGAPAQSPAAEPEDEEEGPIVDIPLDKQQLIGVKTVAAEVRPLHKTIRTVGRVAYNERRLATINTKFEGWIETLHADYAGKYVKKGEPLAELAAGVPEPHRRGARGEYDRQGRRSRAPENAGHRGDHCRGPGAPEAL